MTEKLMGINLSFLQLSDNFLNFPSLLFHLAVTFQEQNFFRVLSETIAVLEFQFPGIQERFLLVNKNITFNLVEKNHQGFIHNYNEFHSYIKSISKDNR